MGARSHWWRNQAFLYFQLLPGTLNPRCHISPSHNTSLSGSRAPDFCPRLPGKKQTAAGTCSSPLHLASPLQGCHQFSAFTLSWPQVPAQTNPTPSHGHALSDPGVAKEGAGGSCLLRDQGHSQISTYTMSKVSPFRSNEMAALSPSHTDRELPWVFCCSRALGWNGGGDRAQKGCPETTLHSPL